MFLYKRTAFYSFYDCSIYVRANININRGIGSNVLALEIHKEYSIKDIA